jgi:hypothetical protein
VVTLLGDVSGNSYTKTGLTNGIAYRYKIKTVRESGSSEILSKGLNSNACTPRAAYTAVDYTEWPGTRDGFIALYAGSVEFNAIGMTVPTEGTGTNPPNPFQPNSSGSGNMDYDSNTYASYKDFYLATRDLIMSQARARVKSSLEALAGGDPLPGAGNLPTGSVMSVKTSDGSEVTLKSAGVDVKGKVVNNN